MEVKGRLKQGEKPGAGSIYGIVTVLIDGRQVKVNVTMSDNIRNALEKFKVTDYCFRTILDPAKVTVKNTYAATEKTIVAPIFHVDTGQDETIVWKGQRLIPSHESSVFFSFLQGPKQLATRVPMGVRFLGVNGITPKSWLNAMLEQLKLQIDADAKQNQFRDPDNRFPLFNLTQYYTDGFACAKYPEDRALITSLIRAAQEMETVFNFPKQQYPNVVSLPQGLNDPWNFRSKIEVIDVLD